MNLKDFIRKTVEDTIEFFKIPIRILKQLRDDTLSEERAQGVQDAVDCLEDFVQQGEDVAEMVIEKKYQQLKNAISLEESEEEPDPKKGLN